MARKPKTGEKSYSICVESTISFYTEVFASSPKEAADKALMRGVMSLPACAHGESTEEWVTELDSEVSGFSLSDATCEGEDVTAEVRAHWDE